MQFMKNSKHKRLLVTLFGLAAVVGGAVLYSYTYSEKDVVMSESRDHKNVVFLIDGKPVQLVNGFAETEAAPGSASKVTTQYFGNELWTDLDGDGREDVAYIITQESGGSGVFYYAVAARNTENGWVRSDGYLLGDRIAPQSTILSPNERHVRVVVFNYVDRAPGEPATNSPSVGKSAYLKLDTANNMWGIVEPHFEGESARTPAPLVNDTWVWKETALNDGTTTKPDNQGVFTVTFKPDGNLHGTTDCNSFFGSYTLSSNTLSVGPLGSTKMYCEGSQENEFRTAIELSTSFHFTEDGNLVLSLQYDSGSVILTKQ